MTKGVIMRNVEKVNRGIKYKQCTFEKKYMVGHRTNSMIYIIITITLYYVFIACQ